MQSEYQHAEDVMDLTGPSNSSESFTAVMQNNPVARDVVANRLQDLHKDRQQLGRKRQRSDEKRTPLFSPSSDSSSGMSTGMETPVKVIVEHTRPPHLSDEHRYTQQNKWYEREMLRKKALVDLREKQLDRVMQCGGVDTAEAAQTAALKALMDAEEQLAALLTADLSVKLPMFFADVTAPQCAAEPVHTAKPTALNFSAAAESEATIRTRCIG